MIRLGLRLRLRLREAFRNAVKGLTFTALGQPELPVRAIVDNPPCSRILAVWRCVNPLGRWGPARGWYLLHSTAMGKRESENYCLHLFQPRGRKNMIVGCGVVKDGKCNHFSSDLHKVVHIKWLQFSTVTGTVSRGFPGTVSAAATKRGLSHRRSKT